MNAQKENAMHFGMVKHHFPEMIEPLRVSIVRDKATPEQIRAWCDKLENPPMRHSWRVSIEGAARYILETEVA